MWNVDLFNFLFTGFLDFSREEKSFQLVKEILFMARYSHTYILQWFVAIQYFNSIHWHSSLKNTKESVIILHHIQKVRIFYCWAFALCKYAWNLSSRSSTVYIRKQCSIRLGNIQSIQWFLNGFVQRITISTTWLLLLKRERNISTCGYGMCIWAIRLSSETIFKALNLELMES